MALVRAAVGQSRPQTTNSFPSPFEKRPETLPSLRNETDG